MSVAETPEPPYTAVVFTSRRSEVDEPGYRAVAERMEALAAEQPGYLGIEAVRDPATRLGITVSYWRTDAHARAWKDVLEHVEAQRMGVERWYESYRVRVATVERDYGSASSADPGEAAGSCGGEF